MTMGDRWGLETPPVETSPVTVEYWRQKALEFQSTLNAVDTVARESWALASVLPEDSPQLASILAGLDEMESKRQAMKMAAEGINAAAAVVNAAGGRFPVLSIPSALGLPPLVIPAAAVAAFTAAAGLISWAVGWVRVQTALIGSSVTALEAIEDPAARADAAREVALIRARAESAASAAGASPLASLASAAKWVGLGALAWFAYRAWKSTRGASSAD